MKKITCILFYLLLPLLGKAQNLVPNGSFESYSSCPTNYSEIAKAIGWWQYHGGTSDYFNCTNIVVGTPINALGYQVAAQGVAYSGVISYNSSANYKEYIARAITPLSIGKRYEVSISVSLANVSGYTTNDIGAWFYDNGPTTTITGSTALSVVPQIAYPIRVTDTTNWVRLSATFIADSAYDNIVIGGFGSSTTTGQSATNHGLGGFGSYAYYYIDSVVVRQTSGINNMYNDSMICAGDTFQVPYTLNSTSLFIGTNIFSVQLSNSSGSFVSGTTIIGTRTATTAGSITCVVPTTITPGTNYRIRILSTSSVDGSNANQYPISIGITRPNVSNSSNTPVCTGQQINLFASSTSSGVSYRWAGPISFISSQQNPTITSATVANSGSYIVTARLFGCIAKDTTVITVSSLSTSIVTTIAASPVCERDSIILSAFVQIAANSYSWIGPDSFISSTKDTFRNNSLPAMSGDYIFSAFYTDCTIRDTVTVLIKPLPANFNATAGTICAGNTLFLSGNTTSTGVNFSWTGPNSFTSTLQNPNIPSATTTASGAYILTATLNGCTDKDTAFGTVFPIPATPVPSANTPVCTGQDLKLTATNVAGAAYSWTSAIGFSSALQNPVRPTATTAMAGKYYVQATANGCSSGIDSVTVTVNPAPTINMYPSPNDSICQGATLTFVSSQSNAGSVFQRKWYRNNTLISAATGTNYATSTAADNDVYYVALTGGNCAEPFTDTSSQILIRVFPWLAPKVTIIANPTTTVPSGTMINFTATPTNGGNSPTYQWTRNGSNIVGALSNIWGAPTLSNNDEICVNMTSSYLCPNPKTVKSNCIKVSIETTGIKGTWIGKQPSIYPNPVKDLLIIEGIQTGTIIQLTDVAGRALIRKTAISNNETLNMQNLISGNYILLLDDNKSNNIRVKITKE